MSVRTSSAVATSIAAALLAGGLLTAGASPAAAVTRVAPAADPAPATVTVTGEGAASATPDMAVLGAGVEATKPTAKEALAAQSAAAAKLLAALRKQGVAERDVQTEGLSLSAVYQQDQAGGPAKQTGYLAGQSFSVTIRDIGKVGAVVQAAADATGDAGRITGVSFDVADPGALQTVARKAAVRDAHDKAAQHAELAGRKLGRLVSLTEGESGRSRPAAMPAAAFDKESVPVAPGQVEDRITVTAVYELD
ncbi:SIMPL domain-containing protein [Streptomyces beijiangensis]|uniref:SIMPL domain-containing protein n=1 Tax=Streptomyces beijiangensis TaxID=163361 RepID=A0A939F4F9_9ACTN|nr:SIMPL domain-containing protein [Streptomyces beijiangensis]MBO0511554.1 SIMPL domain-containing protein [Streptomyces beijiangensis]